MKQKGIVIVATISLLCLFGCNKDLPEPETENQEDLVPVSDPIIVTFQQLNEKDWSVQYFVGNGHLYLECVVPAVSFTTTGGHPKNGKVVVSVDGKKIAEYKRAAFIVKNIPKGKREITIEVVDLHNQPYGLRKTFTIDMR